MDVPKDLDTDLKPLWQKLMIGFRPRNEIQIEAAKRWLVWQRHFQNEKAVVDIEGTVTQGGNGVPYANPHFSNMKVAEDQMRRLWAEIKESFVELTDDTEDLGQFKGL